MKSKGWPQLVTSMEDHKCDASSGVKQQEHFATETGKAFKASDKPLPPEMRKAFMKLHLADVKKAGTASNQRACAATAYILKDASANFENVNMAWTGPIKSKKHTAKSCFFFCILYLVYQSSIQLFTEQCSVIQSVSVEGWV